MIKTTWQLFQNLPRDLRWLILSEFVGSHSVRKGKLIQKMLFGTRHTAVQNVQLIRECNIWLYTNDFKAKSIVYMGEGSQLMFCEDPKSGVARFLFRKRNKRTHSRQEKSYEQIYTPLNDSTTLPPFEKHLYPSFPDTDKKKAARRSSQKPLCLRLPSGEEGEAPLLLPPGSRWQPPLPRSPDSHPPL